MLRPRLAVGVLAFVLVPASAIAAVIDNISTRRVATGLDRPVYVTAAPGDPDRLFIVEQKGAGASNVGAIRVYDRRQGRVLDTPLLTLPNVATGNEQGVLGLAFHPDFQTNGQFYVNYVREAGRQDVTVVERYRIGANPNVAIASSAQTVITYQQPFSNHNGGWMDFGPDGMLYISSGDGGSANDPQNNGQNLNSLLGKMLRIDVNGDAFPSDPNRNYAIPDNNPFAGPEPGGAGNRADEIWSYGLRNPWRPSFDRETGNLIIADVGQNRVEEINVQLALSAGGENFGWVLKEGSGDAPVAGLVDPVYEYSHGLGSNQGFSVTGGYVYRGPISELDGLYFFADYVTERIWSIEIDDNGGLVEGSFTDWTDALQPAEGEIDAIASFGEDAFGNLFIVDLEDGELFEFFSTAVAVPVPAAFWLMAPALAVFGIRRQNAHGVTHDPT